MVWGARAYVAFLCCGHVYMSWREQQPTMSNFRLFSANGLPHLKSPRVSSKKQCIRWCRSLLHTFHGFLLAAGPNLEPLQGQRSWLSACGPLLFLIFFCPLNLSPPYPVLTTCVSRVPKYLSRLALLGLYLESYSCLILPFLFQLKRPNSNVLSSGSLPRLPGVRTPSLTPAACGLPQIRIFFISSTWCLLLAWDHGDVGAQQESKRPGRGPCADILGGGMGKQEEDKGEDVN